MRGALALFISNLGLIGASSYLLHVAGLNLDALVILGMANVVCGLLFFAQPGGRAQACVHRSSYGWMAIRIVSYCCIYLSFIHYREFISVSTLLVADTLSPFIGMAASHFFVREKGKITITALDLIQAALLIAIVASQVDARSSTPAISMAVFAWMTFMFSVNLATGKIMAARESVPWITSRYTFISGTIFLLLSGTKTLQILSQPSELTVAVIFLALLMGTTQWTFIYGLARTTKKTGAFILGSLVPLSICIDIGTQKTAASALIVVLTTLYCMAMLISLRRSPKVTAA